MFSIDTIIFLHLCISDIPYLLRSYPRAFMVTQLSFLRGPCLDLMKQLSFLRCIDDASLDHAACLHSADDLILTCKLGLNDPSSSLNVQNYPLNHIIILVAFIQEFPSCP
ncbi:unnamed protein product [Rotaria magnacalcarata]|uniref:Uncharacterized protein n=1 Tax=Rotaria magnacalcarata TaxID=392030 RepID=A0A816BSK3_9BILA|nr:unnamed protein product [Rotaria magnacalcarata]CAF1615365.1 unnamed protein product [Rotaria magnacalcarata]CAF1961310.1 unnamed protein product [Rotaria magnacalcarata]CAF2144984.1 unnamed protein product [Rotaria magnacalcarata]CAF2240429.1 unnamed protein product [Rotaria magnacalcarata]